MQSVMFHTKFLTNPPLFRPGSFLNAGRIHFDSLNLSTFFKLNTGKIINKLLLRHWSGLTDLSILQTKRKDMILASLLPSLSKQDIKQLYSSFFSDHRFHQFQCRNNVFTVLNEAFQSRNKNSTNKKIMD